MKKVCGSAKEALDGLLHEEIYANLGALDVVPGGVKIVETAKDEFRNATRATIV